MTTYLLAGGGTAGHVNPMLAIAQRLRRDEPSCTIHMLGTAEGLESRLVPEAGFELLTIAKVPFPRRLNRDALRFLSRWRAAVAQVRHVLVQRQVDVVIGVGGYAAAPAYAAAHRERVPFAIHEANARPGLANRLGARWTRFVGIAIPGTAIQHGTLVGMPLRPEFEHVVTSAQKREARQSFGLQPDLPTLVITGGSLGSARLNETTTAVASEFGRAGVQILHITGRGRSVSITSGSVDTGDATSNAGDATSNSVEGGYRVLEYCDRMR
ncbi:MAG: UDP-N-acetylglucosamine--N-acetylmuramyl-(pentapeptide) pyrophosphoryl-undecaprenol N-acetylglucosamine transferase, partial [Microbacteriaceae bacterium]|nr:UDP-N-acetylglucosamine--N-acetylmuramyl-(pentapeptide) pyrophosphoryl-undecaprenol N-acetylglucosamine transferase [Microbacteriaceae bacterium]